jgi:uncharacterized tellurite resistance protein B-like protein
MGPEERERAAMRRVAPQQFDRAEQLILELLAQTDRNGNSPWHVVAWEEVLDRVVALHARVQLIRARMDEPRTDEG